jgi:hypothetical protein
MLALSGFAALIVVADVAGLVALVTARLELQHAGVELSGAGHGVGSGRK